MLHLDARNRPISGEVTSVGTLTGALVHPREVFKSAILQNAAGIIAGHNHPSGDWSPSREDRELKSRLAAAAEILGIPLLEFLVVTAEEGSYWSAADAGEI